MSDQQMPDGEILKVYFQDGKLCVAFTTDNEMIARFAVDKARATVDRHFTEVELKDAIEKATGGNGIVRGDARIFKRNRG